MCCQCSGQVSSRDLTETLQLHWSRKFDTNFVTFAFLISVWVFCLEPDELKANRAYLSKINLKSSFSQPHIVDDKPGLWRGIITFTPSIIIWRMHVCHKDIFYHWNHRIKFLLHVLNKSNAEARRSDTYMEWKSDISVNFAGRVRLLIV